MLHTSTKLSGSLCKSAKNLLIFYSRRFISFKPIQDPEIQYTKLFINNEFVNSKSGKTFPTVNPATCNEITKVSEGDKEDIDVAVCAAKDAFKSGTKWRKMSSSKRSKLMLNLTQLMKRDINCLASIETLDNGKPFTEAVVDVISSIETIQYYAGWCDKFTGDTLACGTLSSMTKKQPIGVVGQIIPWNFPLSMLAWKWGPALATGCTIVMKPAEQTPLTALFMAALSREAGFPDGVINVIPGYGPTAGAAISSHPDIRKVAFTGSLEVGKIIMRAAADSNLKRVSLELGGKSPLVVCEDANVDEAVAIAHEGLFYNHGQSCCAGSRTFVHENIYDEFVKKSVAMAKCRKVGNPFEKDVEQGPQINDEAFKKILEYIKLGKKEGAKLEFGGKRFGDVGYFIMPTVFSNVTDDMKIAQEEIFGPVQCILKYSTIDEVIERSNNTNYGLAAGIITSNINKAITFSNLVDAGSIWVNCYNAIIPQAPFGGFKESGFGRELGKNGLENYLETKTITMQISSKCL